MNVLKFLAGTALILGILLFLLDLFAAPKAYSVTRTQTIDAPVTAVFSHVSSLEKTAAWSPWNKKDPNMKKEYAGAPGEVGSTYTWDGNEEVGSGKQEIVKIVPNKKVESKLYFYTPYEAEADALITLKEKDKSSTQVSWRIGGRNNTFMERMLSLFKVINMEAAIGPDFESGLADLKTLVESEYSQTTSKEPAEAGAN